MKDTNNPKISIIVAVAKDNVIGGKNRLLWHILDDLKKFKRLTAGHAIVMGRKTHESIGRLLPNRFNIVISSDASKKSDDPNLIYVTSLEDALTQAKKFENNRQDALGTEIFVIGGEQIYEQALPLADKLYLTKVDASFAGDTFFPDYSEFKKVVAQESRNANGFSYQFIELER